MPRLLALMLLTGIACRSQDEPPAPTPMPTKPTAIPAKTDKRPTIEAMLKRGAVRVHLDARRPGVVVPPENRNDIDLVLRIGRNLAPPIPDLVVDDRGISGSLVFHGKTFRCVMPWPAVFAAVVEGEPNGSVWQSDVPPDLPK